MAQATVAAEIHQALDVHRHVAAKIAFDLVLAIDGFADLQDFGVGQFADAAFGRDLHPCTNVLGKLRADAVNILKSDHDAFLRRNVHTCDTSHVPSLLVGRTSALCPSCGARRAEAQCAPQRIITEVPTEAPRCWRPSA
jgi:hypothetical protein